LKFAYHVIYECEQLLID